MGRGLGRGGCGLDQDDRSLGCGRWEPMVGGALSWRLGSSSWWAGLEHDGRGLGCGWRARPVVQPFCMFGWRLEGLGISQPLLPQWAKLRLPRWWFSFFNFENFVSTVFTSFSPLPFTCLFLSQNLSSSLGWPRTLYVDQAGLVLRLPLPPKNWG